MTERVECDGVELADNGLIVLDDWTDFVALTAQQGVNTEALIIASVLATASAVAMHRNGLTIDGLVSLTGLARERVEGGLHLLERIGIIESFDVELDDGAVQAVFVPAAQTLADPFNYPDHWGADDVEEGDDLDLVDVTYD